MDRKDSKVKINIDKKESSKSIDTTPTSPPTKKRTTRTCYWRYSS